MGILLVAIKKVVYTRRSVTPGRATILVLLVMVSILYLGLEINTELMLTRRQTQQYQVIISLANKESPQKVPKIENKKSNKSDLEKAEDIEKMFPNLPMVFWQTYNSIEINDQSSNKSKYEEIEDQKDNKECGELPNILDIHYNNIYWQQMESGGGTFLLYAAFLDTRSSCSFCPMIRVLGMVNRVNPSTTFCQIWIENERKPVLSPVFENKLIWSKNFGHYRDGVYLGYMLGCKVPEIAQNTSIDAVSVVEKECDKPSTLLKVVKNQTEDKNRKLFAVCVKGLDFLEDNSVRIVEWIELLAALGVDNIITYELEVHPNVSKVLNYYKSTGFLVVTKHTLAGHQPNLATLQHWYLAKRRDNKRQNEVITYNDCFYRNMYKYQYIALLDIDEVIIPKNASSWGDMIRTIRKNKTVRSSYCFQNIYFLNNMTKYNEKVKAGVLL